MVKQEWRLKEGQSGQTPILFIKVEWAYVFGPVALDWTSVYVWVGLDKNNTNGPFGLYSYHKDLSCNF